MFYTIIGTQWGDEGKGKIVDWLASKVDTVVRFQGGNNAGHTIQINESKYKLNLLPSGIIRGKKCIIGNGVVLDPWALVDEIVKLNKQNIEISDRNLMIAENTCLILPIHKIIDEINEIERGNAGIGTTKKGIGPAYEDKVGRRSIRLCDLENEDILKRKISSLVKFHSPRLTFYNKNVDAEDLYKQLSLVAKKILTYSYPTWQYLNELAKKNKNILFEGAQGALLDIDFGTYPYVTSSNTSSGQIFAGSGFNTRTNNKILGITKAYTTRVGSGPFPTELNDQIGDYLVEKGQEYGTVTKRKRRCGWFDINLVKQSINISGINNIVLTKLDVLDHLNEIKLCIGYQFENIQYSYLPANENLQFNVKPIYKTYPGWKESTFGLNNWDDLPLNAKKYVNSIEELLETEISIVSTGPERSQTIDRKNFLDNI